MVGRQVDIVKNKARRGRTQGVTKQDLEDLEGNEMADQAAKAAVVEAALHELDVADERERARRNQCKKCPKRHFGRALSKYYEMENNGEQAVVEDGKPLEVQRHELFRMGVKYRCRQCRNRACLRDRRRPSVALVSRSAHITWLVVPSP